jgi:predicted transcriptional regulator
MDPNYLYINMNYFTLGLKPIDVLIIALVEELQNKGLECCYTNEYFAHTLGVSVSSVKSSLNKLYQKRILDHRTYTVYGNGRANRQRVLTVTPPIVWDLAA